MPIGCHLIGENIRTRTNTWKLRHKSRFIYYGYPNVQPIGFSELHYHLQATAHLLVPYTPKLGKVYPMKPSGQKSGFKKRPKMGRFLTNTPPHMARFLPKLVCRKRQHSHPFWYHTQQHPLVFAFAAVEKPLDITVFTIGGSQARLLKNLCYAFIYADGVALREW